MDRLKERWEFIVGYVALIVSLSAFKDELTKIGLNLGFFSTTAAQFLFALILSFVFTMHLYLIPFLLSSTRYANARLLRLLESLSYLIFVLLAVSPIFVLVSVGVNSLVNFLRATPAEARDVVTQSATALIGAVLGVISSILAARYRKQKYSSQKQELEFQEIKEFENTQKLFNDGYFSQSILEAFKVMELHLRRLILQKDIPFRSTKFQDVLDLAMKLELLDKSEVATIKRIRQMRNSAAHLDVDFTKAEAGEAIDFIKKMIRKTSSQANSSAT